MSDAQLYEIARRRIQQRNRRWSLWALNLGVLILTLAGLILTGSEITVAIFIAWAAIFVVHTIILGFAESSESSIENEVARLRKATTAAATADRYEKPKRLELGEDGELLEMVEEPSEAEQFKRK